MFVSAIDAADAGEAVIACNGNCRMNTESAIITPTILSRIVILVEVKDVIPVCSTRNSYVMIRFEPRGQLYL